MTGERETIALDLDDVLADHVEAFVEQSSRLWGTEFGVNDYVERWSELWRVDEAEAERRALQLARTGWVGGFTVKAGAVAGVSRLRQDYDLVIVTVRRRPYVEVTHQWLRRHFPDCFKTVRFLPVWEETVTQTKADIGKELGATYLIDDQPKHCRLAAEAGLRTVLFGDYNWNRLETLPYGVTRCRDWPAVLEYFYGR